MNTPCGKKLESHNIARRRLYGSISTEYLSDFEKVFEMYSKETERYISNEFRMLQDTCYLDHTGATLYAKSQITAVNKELNQTIFGNPHSLNLSSRHTTDVIDQVRYRILKHFHTDPDEYSVVFTAGATAALKLLAESFRWQGADVEACSSYPKSSAQKIVKNGMCSPKDTCNCEVKAPLVEAQASENKGTLVYLQDNHTSVLGLRELAAEKGACIHCMPHDFAFTTFGRKEPKSPTGNKVATTYSLFVYPAQCNFSGVKYPLGWINKVHSGYLNCSNANCCHNTKWFCCLDAASYVSTNDLDLSTVKPDFVCMSFYKIFGYPTGIGALLVRNSSAHTLKRNYFGGGTVQISLSSERFHVPRPSLSDQFEDGTIPFLSIVALRHGFDTLQSLTGGMVNVTLHTLFLSRYVHHSLLLMHHNNGAPAVILYCDTDYEDFSTQGNIVNFNLLRSNGEHIGFAEVLQMANLHGIHLRTGCFCNPGACQRHLNLSVRDLKRHYQAGHICGDEMDLINGNPTGSVRISFGYMSTKQDADKFLGMITSCFIEAPIRMCVPQWWPNFRRMYREKFGMKSLKNGCSTLSNIEHVSVEIKSETLSNNTLNKSSLDVYENKHSESSKLSDDELLSSKVKQCLSISSKECSVDKTTVQSLGCYQLINIYLYPVKSCGAMSVSSWEISSRGLKYDREWMIVTPSGVALTQKQETKLCLIKPKIDLVHQCLTLEFEGLLPVRVPLTLPNSENKNEKEASLCQSKVCGDHVQGWDCGEEVAEWLCTALNREGLRLLHQRDTKSRTTKPRTSQEKTIDTAGAEISLANEAQFLLVNVASVSWLTKRLTDVNLTTENLIARFRCNFVVDGENAFEETNWTKLRIGNVELTVDGPCRRCQMVCIDQQTGERTREPLQSLAAAFHGKMRFGIYLQHREEEERTVDIGNDVNATWR